MEEKLLAIIHCDEISYQNEQRRKNMYIYKFSSELFFWFYKNAKYYKEPHEQCWYPMDIDLKRTYEDNSRDGCRIWDSRGYFKLTESQFLFEMEEEDFDYLRKELMHGEIYLSDLVNFFYTNKL